MHIGIIMDGNRRWAKSKGLPKFAGHKKGVDNLENLLDLCLAKNIEIVTVYALSTENLKREPDELKNLFKLLEKYVQKPEKFIKKGIQVRPIGNLVLLPEKTQIALKKIKIETQNCQSLIFNLAIAYGGRDEIVRAIHKIQEKALNITEENITQNLDTLDFPQPDLIIRTGGDYRLSNFLIWQASYATLYFTPVFWPDFNQREFEKALDFLNNQKQNYGR